MSTRAVQDVSIDQIVCRKQIRERFSEEELAGLAQSIAEHGILQPLLVHREEGAFVLDDGERRLRAAKIAGLSSVPVIVDPRQFSRTAVIERQLIANCQRADLSAIEKARAIDRLVQETKCTASDVAIKLGLSPASVSRLLSLLGLPDSVKKRLEAGELSPSAAYEITRAGDASEQETLAAEASLTGMTRDALTARRKSAATEAASAGSRQTPARVTAKLGAGRTVTLTGPGLTSLDQLVNWLEELLAKARKARPRGVELATFVALLKDEAKAASGEQPC